MVYLLYGLSVSNTTHTPHHNRRRRRCRCRRQLKENTAEMFGIELAAEYEYKFSSAKVHTVNELGYK